MPTGGPGRTEALAAAHLANLACRPSMTAGKVLLLGTGRRQLFPPAPWLKPLIDLGIGVEVMDTGAACRTYNVLVAEGRDVAAALIVE
ncbi:MAG: Mth938-like domain-containing protein [Rhodocyclaceae bacterium]|nr:Mth938-like domain-containing protein [Rhodocyclaceae bacterium]